MLEEAQVDSAPTGSGSGPSLPAKRSWLSGAVLLLFFGGLAAIIFSAPGKLTSASLVGSDAPEFEIVAINGEHVGRPFALRDLRGKSGSHPNRCDYFRTAAQPDRQASETGAVGGEWSPGCQRLTAMSLSSVSVIGDSLRLRKLEV